jgi:hypothetical protein
MVQPPSDGDKRRAAQGGTAAAAFGDTADTIRNLSACRQRVAAAMTNWHEGQRLLGEERKAVRARDSRQRADVEELLREAAAQRPGALRQVLDRVYGATVDERCRRVVADELPDALGALTEGAD